MSKEEEVIKLGKVVSRKVHDIMRWPFQIIFYDERGKRVFTDYVAYLDMAIALVIDYPKVLERRGKKVPKIALIVERKVVDSRILEE